MQTIKILETNPSLENDANLFKLVFTPLELFTLKIFLREKAPISIGLIYTEAMLTIGHAIFFGHLEEVQGDFSKDMINTDYLSVLINEENLRQTQTEAIQLRDHSPSLSLTNLSRFYQIKLKSLNCKVPSYDKIKGIVVRFVKLGVLSFRGKEGKNILYIINPTFHKKFESKYKKILEL